MDILQAIGNTSLVQLGKVGPAGGAGVFAKLEWEDRMAHAVISRAEADGRLKPGGTGVEYTGGSTGTWLAMVCAARGYRIRIVTSDAFSKEKRDHMAALGAELTLVQSEEALFAGTSSGANVIAAIQVARRSGADATVVTLMVDSGLKYLSTDVFANK